MNVSLYAVCVEDPSCHDVAYFAGYDAQAQRASYTPRLYDAKLFTNKADVKLRPNEKLVELEVAIDDQSVVWVSAPFRPRMPKKLYAALHSKQEIA